MTYLGKSHLFGLLCVSFVNVYQFVCVLFSPFGFEDGMWDLINYSPALKKWGYTGFGLSVIP